MPAKSMPNKTNLGIVLVTTLLTVVLVVMMVTTVVHSGISGLALTANFYDREAALQAAESGLQYAFTRTQECMSWPKQEVVMKGSKADGFEVCENNGNIVGLIYGDQFKHKSAFRIKYNFEDNGSSSFKADPPKEFEAYSASEGSTVDYKSNFTAMPADNYSIASPYVSINNIIGTVAVPVYRANNDGQGCSGRFNYVVPSGTACIIVEGLAGPGVREAELGDIAGLKTGVSSKILEAYFSIDPDSNVDAAACAAGTIEADVEEYFTVSSSPGAGIPKLRSQGDASIDNNKGRFTMTGGGEVIVGKNKKLSANRRGNGITVTQGDSKDRFKKLGWNDIAKADDAGNDYEILPAGTYVWSIQDGSPVLKYYKGSFPPGTSLKGAEQGTVALPKGVVVDTENMAILIGNNMKVSSDGTTKDFVVRTDATVTGQRPVVGFVPPEGSTSPSILTTAGNVGIQGGVMGTGAITSEGCITFQGASVLESDPDTGVSLYAQGDINLTSIERSSKKAQKGGRRGQLFPNNVLPASRQSVCSDFRIIDSLGELAIAPVVNYSNFNSSGAVQVQGPPWFWGWGGGGHHHRDHDYDDYDDDDYPTSGGTVETDPTAPGTAEPTEPVDEDYVTQVDAVAVPENIAINNSSEAAIIVDNDLIRGGDADSYAARKRAQLQALINRHNSLTYADQDITGIIYTWGNFNVNIGKSSLLNVNGTIIAYGGNPDGQPGNDSKKGNIEIAAKNVDLEYNPTFIKNVLNRNSSILLTRTLWTSW